MKIIYRKGIHSPCMCDKCLQAWYLQPCVGCVDGHNSFWKTVIESKQWKKWKKYAWEDNMLYDFPEVEELGTISPEHFQAFLKFTRKQKTAS